jgi:hypothetical protein
LHITNNWSYGNAYTIHRTKDTSSDIRPDISSIVLSEKDGAKKNGTVPTKTKKSYSKRYEPDNSKEIDWVGVNTVTIYGVDTDVS